MVTNRSNSDQDRRQIALHKEPKLLAPGVAIKIDRAIVLKNIALVSGWMSGSIKLLIPDTKKHVIYERNDVSSDDFGDVRGFLVITCVMPDERVKNVTVQYGDVVYNSPIPLSSELAEIQKAFIDHMPRLAHVWSEIKHIQEWCRLLYPYIPHYSSDLIDANIEQSRALTGVGVSVLGRCLCRNAKKVWFFSEIGQVRPLAEAVRYYRRDVVNELADRFGSHSEMAGFFCSLPGPVPCDMKISVVAEIAGVLFKVQEKMVEKGPSTALGYARWAFGISLPDSGFAQRLEHHDGKFIEELVRRETNGEEPSSEVWSVGPRPASPMASVIVPVYKRGDFVEHQLLSFERDKDVTERFAELVYVIDDSTLYDYIKQESFILYQLYGVPMTFVFGGRNRGFSGANNLGASIARGEYLIFLNSDVFPEETGWIGRMVDALISEPHYGIVGARLLYPQGTVQHMGMEFAHSDSFGIWLNEHPGHNLPTRKDLPAIITVPAVTGACLAIGKEDFTRVGGFDESYLVGDFEDSDLCLKIRSTGKDIGCFTDTRLIHLERQSVRHSGGNDSFRQRVVLYNGWKHSARWDGQIRLNANG